MGAFVKGHKPWNVGTKVIYDKRNNNPENLIALCDVCHGQTHWNRDDWTQYFQTRRYGKC